MLGIHKAALWLVTASLTITACGSPSPISTESIEGIWWLDSFLIDGTAESIHLGINTNSQPWIEIGDRIRGDLGCNDFDTFTPHTLEGDQLTLGEGMMSAVGCVGEHGEDVMRAERAFSIVAYPPPITVMLEGDRMTWINHSSELRFVRALSHPTTTTASPPSSIGSLDCSPGHVNERFIVDDTRDTEQILRDEVPAVAAVGRDPLFAPDAPDNWIRLGSDATGQAIALIARGDVEPPRYQLFTCE